jgi:hypothetical protein
MPHSVAKPVPSGKEVEMCRLTSGGDRLLKVTEGRADCAAYGISEVLNEKSPA